MIADTQSPRDVLCLAGGTGLAPVKAVVEALISAPEPGRHREIVLYYGARRHQDLYDLRSLQGNGGGLPVAPGHPGGF
jgi:NAD(P)H-flavin reductase